MYHTCASKPAHKMCDFWRKETWDHVFTVILNGLLSSENFSTVKQAKMAPLKQKKNYTGTFIFIHLLFTICHSLMPVLLIEH